MKDFIITLGLGFLIAYAQYNVIRDASFEQDSEVWRVFIMPDTQAAKGSRHLFSEDAPDSDYVGYVMGGTGGAGTSEDPFYSGGAQLIQEFIPRVMKDFDIENNLSFYIIWIQTQTDGPYKWGVKLISKNDNILEFLNIGIRDTWTLWKSEKSIYELWKQHNLPESDSLYKIILFANGYTDPTGPFLYGQSVKFDRVRLLSSRFDIDGAVLSLDSPKDVELNQTYKPIATLKNLGALPIMDATVSCVIYDGYADVYGDTVKIDSLYPDETTQVLFKDWLVDKEPDIAYELKIFFSVEGEQNEGDNRLQQVLSFKTGVEEKDRVAKINPSIFSKQAVFYLSEGERMRLYSIEGRLLREFYDSNKDGKIIFGAELKPGVYFYRIGDKTGKVVKAKR